MKCIMCDRPVNPVKGIEYRSYFDNKQCFYVYRRLYPDYKIGVSEIPTAPTQTTEYADAYLRV